MIDAETVVPVAKAETAVAVVRVGAASVRAAATAIAMRRVAGPAEQRDPEFAPAFLNLEND